MENTTTDLASAGAMTRALEAAELIDRFLASHDIKATSRQTYRAGLQRFLEWFKACGVQPVTEAQLIAYKQSLEAARLSAHTIAIYIVSLRLFFKWAARAGICTDAAASLKLPKRSKDFHKDPLTAEQARDLLAGIDRSTLAGMRDYALMVLAISRGLRTIEIRRANIGDIRLVAGQHVLQVHGKGRDSKDQQIPLSEPVLKPIMAYLQARGASSDSEPIFVSVADSNSGQRLTTRSISRICKQHLKRFGLNSRRLTAHSLRHTCGTLATPANATFADVESVQALLRHENLTTSMIYMHSAKSGGQAASRVDAFLFSEDSAQAAPADAGIESNEAEALLISALKSLSPERRERLLQQVQTATQA